MDETNNTGSCACCCSVDEYTTPDMLYIIERIGESNAKASLSGDVGYAVTKGLTQSLSRLYEHGSNADVLGMLQVMNALADIYPEDRKISRELAGNCLSMIYHFKKQEMKGEALCALTVMSRMMVGEGKPIDRDIGCDNLAALACLVGAYVRNVCPDKRQEDLFELCDIEKSEGVDIAKRDVGPISEHLNMEFAKGLEYAISYLAEHGADDEIQFVHGLMELFVGQFCDPVMDEMLAKSYAVPSRRFVRSLGRPSAKYHYEAAEDSALVYDRLRGIEKLVKVYPESLSIARCFAGVCADMVMYHAKDGDVDRVKEFLVKIRGAGERFDGDSVVGGEFKKAFGFAKKCVMEGEGDAERRMKRLESRVEVVGGGQG